LEEVGVCFKVRVCLCYRKECLKSSRKFCFCFFLSFNTFCAHCSRSSLSNVFKCFTFMCCIPLYCFNEIRDEIVSSLQLHIDIAPRFINSVSKGNETIVEEDDCCTNHNSKNKNDDKDN